jgi:ribosomal protein L37AE/L43A
VSAPLYKSASGLMLNMYDCTPCPKCGSTYRTPYKRSGMLVCECDECNFKEPWTAANGRPESDVEESP